jgi:hypothetical protein
VSFTRNFDETVTFIQQARATGEWSRASGQPCRIDFRPIQRVAPAALLCLVAEMHANRLLSGDRPMIAHHPEQWNPEVLFACFELGMFSILSDMPSPEQSTGSLRILRFRSRATTSGADVAHLSESLAELHDLPIDTKALYATLMETIANSVEHAYSIPGAAELATGAVGRRWWASGAVDQDVRRMKVIAYDRGATIPATLPHSRRWSALLEAIPLIGVALRSSDPGEMIRWAIQGRITRTAKGNRGRGLGKYQLLAERSQGDRLRIISGQGLYIYTHGGSPVVRTRAVSLPGTLVEWDLALPAAGDRDG